MLTLGKMLLCLVTMFWWGPPVTRWVFRQAEKLHGHHKEVAAALILAFLLAFDAEWLGSGALAFSARSVSRIVATDDASSPAPGPLGTES